MAILHQLRSPLPWMGGKHYSAAGITRAFPSPDTYDVYTEIFCGACHVLIAKPPFKHVEVINDRNGDLINFWIQCRDHPQALEDRCRTLPYSRELYYHYHKSLFDGTDLDNLERAARWFYVLRNNFNGYLRSTPCGWSLSLKDKNHGQPQAYHSAISFFTLLSQRLKYVAIDNRDFTVTFKQNNKPRTLIYADPPYIGYEQYFDPDTKDDPMEMHYQLASLLNNTKAYVALSYYPHPFLDELYPKEKWRRIVWNTSKHSQRTKSVHDSATEMLLCNYPAQQQSLWEVPLEG